MTAPRTGFTLFKKKQGAAGKDSPLGQMGKRVLEAGKPGVARKKDPTEDSPLKRMGAGPVAGKGGPLSFHRAGSIAAMRAEHAFDTPGEQPKKAAKPKAGAKGAPVPPPSASSRAAKLEEKLEHAKKRPAKRGMNFGAYEDRDD